MHVNIFVNISVDICQQEFSVNIFKTNFYKLIYNLYISFDESS